MILAEFKYTVHHLPSQRNLLADSLSRIPNQTINVEELSLALVGSVETTENYENFYVDIINYLRTGNSFITIADANVVRFKQHCHNYFLYGNELIYKTLNGLKRIP